MSDIMNAVPEYAKSPVFQEMISLCNQAGLEVRFIKRLHDDSFMKGTVMAETSEDDDTINMNYDGEHYENPDDAAAILGHELAHHLVKDWYEPHEKQVSDHETLFDWPLYRAIEGDCDRIGAALYKLVELIAVKKAEDAFKNAAERDKE